MAEAAGVSEMTVSRVLSGKGVVSARTRDRVMAVVARTGYVRNRLAGSLGRSRSDQVAVVIPSLGNAIFDEVVDGIGVELSRKDYNPVLGISDYDERREESLLQSMLSWRPAGVILPAIGHTARVEAMLRNADVPIVEIMNTGRRRAGIAVGIDQHGAGRASARHLIDRGRTRIAWIGWDPRDLSAAARLDGARAVAAERDVVLVEPRAPSAGAVTLLDGRRDLAALLAADPAIDAAIFANDTAAAGGMMHCLAEGVDVPGRVALMGYGDTVGGRVLPRRLTTISPPRRAIGRIAARCILDTMRGVAVGPVIDVGFELVTGETS
ncbi:LacI family DNA-binding transcriptional regulator [Jannaschia sp. LMIT008]|uniref:LacI family DNA-binding transcriptional regulator n=1 Tax=Jannaschia maritima TaxID=3032585 RepID=UPI002811C0F2|nr:LacI family DNA-binding transcriptional regulator [Jannaschia sp. LMIT008]